MALEHWVQLSLTEGIGPILTARIVEAAGSAEEACVASVDLLRNVEGIGVAKGRQIRDSLKRAGDLVDEELAKARGMGVSAVCLDDAGYPPLLKSIQDPPPVLWIRGEFQARDLNAMAIVGSRRCSHYGREQSERFGALLAQAGFTVVSGGARGVDSAAHRGAMSLPAGRTIAVLGCGVDIAYPPENAALFTQVSERGAVVSEFALGSPPVKENFPRRNRIISGMSRGVLVTEADVASGALITARMACDSHNRPVFAVPGKIDNPMSAGPHALIRDGAVLVTGLEDIVGNLGPLPFDVAKEAEAAAREIEEEPKLFEAKNAVVAVDLDVTSQRIVDEIGDDPTTLDAIVARSELPAEKVMQALTMLSLRGVVKRVGGQSYVRNLGRSV
jgi:DNA processing protein